MIDFGELYLIGEIGINHNGDLQIAKKLIDASFACDWDCVKFQKRNPDVCVPDHQKDVLRQTPWGEMTYLEYKYRVEFGENEYDYIDSYCKEKQIDWTVSVWDLDSLEFMSRYKVPFIKIPSAMLTNDALIQATADTGNPIILSTGMSTLEEVDHAVSLLSDRNFNDYAILHCNSTYPAPIADLNLNNIKMFSDRYNVPVGYSGHESNVIPSVIAHTLGANIIERHITLNHNMWGTDQKTSLEVHAMNMLKARCDDARLVLGSYERVLCGSELEVRKKLRGN